MRRHAHRYTSSIAKRGFTLIEMLVVVVIIIVVSAAVLINGGAMGGQYLLDTFAYDMALTVRQAQQYGIAVRSQGGTFKTSYGMHFDDPGGTVPDAAKQYHMFADTAPAGAPPGDGIYGMGDAIVQALTINRGFRIIKICATPSGTGAVEDCTLKTLDIVFRRPEPEALISIKRADDTTALCFSGGSNCQDSARIELRSPRGNTRSVIIPRNGQIYVQ